MKIFHFDGIRLWFTELLCKGNTRMDVCRLFFIVHLLWVPQCPQFVVHATNILLLKPRYFSLLTVEKNPHVQHWTKQVCDIFWHCNESLLEHSIFSFLSFLFLSFKLISFSCAWGRRQLIKAEFLFTDKFRRQASSQVPWISCIPTTFFPPVRDVWAPHRNQAHIVQ